jgi:glycosyltransferase involved in cell wall biosynthesis
MNILIFSSVWAPSIGGVQSVTNTLARALASYWKQRDQHDQRVEVTVATRTPAGDAPGKDGVLRVERAAGIFRLLRLVWKSDVVHIAGPALLPLFLAWLLRKKAVIHHHGYQAVCPDGSPGHFADQRVCVNSLAAGAASECLPCRAAKPGWFRGAMSVILAYPRLWLCRHVAANVAVSDHLSARLGLPRSTTIYSAPADLPTAPSTPLSGGRRGLDCLATDEAPLIAFVGRLVAEKGVNVLLHAAAKLAAEKLSFRVRIIGDGPELPRLAALAWALDLRDRVEFKGWLEEAELDEALEGAAAVAVPSIYEETAGLVAIEQMMRGRVVVASDIGGLSEIVGNAGFRFPPGDATALANCLKRVLTDAELRGVIGRAARERALALFTRERMAGEFMNVYRAIQEKAGTIAPQASISSIASVWKRPDIRKVSS